MSKIVSDLEEDIQEKLQNPASDRYSKLRRFSSSKIKSLTPFDAILTS